MNGWQVVFLPYSRRWLCIAADGRCLCGNESASVERSHAVRAEAVRTKEQVGRAAAATRKLARSRASNLAGSLGSFSTNLGNLKSTLAGAARDGACD